MQKLIFILKVTVIVSLIASCSSGKAITGEISHVSGDTVVCAGRMIKVAGNVPEVGKKVVFIPTRDKAKVNAKIIH